jgi:hypothetical protein
VRVHGRPAWLLLPGLAAAVLVAALPRPVGASYFDYAFGGQAQFTALAGMTLPDTDFGVAELQVNAAMWSIGVALGAAYERFPNGSDGALNGGAFHGALQWRFLALVPGELSRWLDPHVDLGFLLGGVGDGSDSWFHGAGYLGGSLDLSILPPDEMQVLVTVQYRWSPDALQTPDVAPDHLLLFGIGLRNVVD